jgi:hypothetical protein
MTNLITCHVCGAQNDPSNRFCDQCGARLDTAEPMSEETLVSQQPPSAEPLSCAVCGAQVLPGQVFCDNCGADLRTNPPVGAQPAAPTDVTMMSPAVPPEQPPAGDADETLIEPPAPEPAPEPPAPEPAPEPPAPEPAPEPPAAAPPSAPSPEPEVPVRPAAPSVPQQELTPPPLTPEAAPVPPPPPAPQPDLAAQRQQLEGEVERHRDSVSKVEQMVDTFPAGSVPPYLKDALDAARQALAKAEQDLAALPVEAVPDPAEVQRLEDERSRHSATIAQMEQVLQVYPAGGAPAYLTSALEDARRALGHVENELAALHGQQVPSPPPPAPTSVPSPAPMPAPEVEATAPAAPEPEPPAPAPEAAPAPAPAPPVGPRLVLINGEHEIPLPTEKSEIIVGREDPVSHIFPEIDLTPFGGESGGVSRQHARIQHSNDQWMIADLNSTNFTHVDGKRIEPNVAVPLYDGVQIRFGRISMVFKL